MPSTATNKVGVIEGLGANARPHDAPYSGCCNNNGDDGGPGLRRQHARTSGRTTCQTPKTCAQARPCRPTGSTCWSQTYKPNNQFYLAAKYGGFKVPDGFDSDYNTTRAHRWTGGRPTATWFDTRRASRAARQLLRRRPSRQLVAGLTRAFETSLRDQGLHDVVLDFLPQVPSAGNAQLRAQYDANDWTGEIIGQRAHLRQRRQAARRSRSGRVTDKLATQLAGTGWRHATGAIATWNTDTRGRAVPQRQPLADPAARRSTRRTSRGERQRQLPQLPARRPQQRDGLDRAGSSQAYRSAPPAGRHRRREGDAGRPAERSATRTRSTPATRPSRRTWANRPTMVYVGANDGMLHAFNGALTGADAAASSMFAYVPSALYQGPSGDAARRRPGARSATRLRAPLLRRRHAEGLRRRLRPHAGRHRRRRRRHSRLALDPDRRPGQGRPELLRHRRHRPGGDDHERDDASPARCCGSSPTRPWATATASPVVKTQVRLGRDPTSGYNNSDGKGYSSSSTRAPARCSRRSRPAHGRRRSMPAWRTSTPYVPDRTDGTADAATPATCGQRLALRPDGDRRHLSRAGEDRDAAGRRATAAADHVAADDRDPPTRTSAIVLVGTGRLLHTSDIAQHRGQTFYSIVDGTDDALQREHRPAERRLVPAHARQPDGQHRPADGHRRCACPSMGWYTDLGVAEQALHGGVINRPIHVLRLVAFASILPNGDACEPVRHQPRLRRRLRHRQDGADGGGLRSASPASSRDLTLLQRGRQAAAIAGPTRARSAPSRATSARARGMRRLNWRELPVVD